MNDQQFQAIVEKAFDYAIDDAFFSKIVGSAHVNDGAEILGRCEPMEIFDLLPEPTNPVDPKAVAVYRISTREQVGWLPERTAHDLLKRMEEPNCKWVAVMREYNRSHETGTLVGANILVVCLNSPPKVSSPA